MSGARRAAATKKKSQAPTQSQNPPSPKKRKSPEPKSENPTPNSDSAEKSLETNISAESDSPQMAQAGGLNAPKKELEIPNYKRAKAVDVDEFVAHLKKKPANFDPKMAAWWEHGDKVPFLFLAKALDLIKDESGRIVITDITCNLLRTVIATNPDDLLGIVYLLANKIAPAHEGVELGIGDASLIKALAEACGATESVVKKSYQVK